MFKRTLQLTTKERHKVAEMSGKTMLHILEGDSMARMSENLKLEPWQIQHNIDEALYTLKRYVGWKRYLKILFTK